MDWHLGVVEGLKQVIAVIGMEFTMHELKDMMDGLNIGRRYDQLMFMCEMWNVKRYWRKVDPCNDLYFVLFCFSFGMIVTNEGETLYHPVQSVYLRQEIQNVGRDISNYEVRIVWNVWLLDKCWMLDVD